MRLQCVESRVAGPNRLIRSIKLMVRRGERSTRGATLRGSNPNADPPGNGPRAGRPQRLQSPAVEGGSPHRPSGPRHHMDWWRGGRSRAEKCCGDRIRTRNHRKSAPAPDALNTFNRPRRKGESLHRTVRFAPSYGLGGVAEIPCGAVLRGSNPNADPPGIGTRAGRPQRFQ